MKLNSYALAGALVVAVALPAFAQGSCSEPIPPAPVNGRNLSEKQLSDVMADAKMFMKQSDDYQNCLEEDLKAQAAAAQKNKKQLDPSIAGDMQTKIDANQKLKERVGAEANTAAVQFCQAHPTVNGCDKVLNPPAPKAATP